MGWLFDTSEFATRNTCGTGWTPQLVSFYQLANFLIALAYFAIPLSLGVLFFKLRGIRPATNFNPLIVLMFLSFILLCGITHITHVVVFWYPVYRLFAFLDMITAIVSLITAIVLPMVVYDLIRRLRKNDDCE